MQRFDTSPSAARRSVELADLGPAGEEVLLSEQAAGVEVEVTAPPPLDICRHSTDAYAFTIIITAAVGRTHHPVVCHLSSVICHTSSVICHLSSFMSSVIYHPSSVIYLLSVIWHPSSSAIYLLPVICHPSSVSYHLSLCHPIICGRRSRRARPSHAPSSGARCCMSRACKKPRHPIRSPSLITPTEGRGGCSRMTVSPTATIM